MVSRYVGFLMNRRRFLVFGGLGIGVGGGYFGWNWYTSPRVPTGMQVETLHFEGDALTESASRNRDQPGWKQKYHSLIADAGTANSELRDVNPLGSFIHTTDFEESYLIVVQNGMQSEMELVLDTITRTEHGLHLEISIDSPRSGPDDLTLHSLLIRITDTQSELPAEVTIDITGYV